MVILNQVPFSCASQLKNGQVGISLFLLSVLSAFNFVMTFCNLSAVCLRGSLAMGNGTSMYLELIAEVTTYLVLLHQFA